MFGNVGILGYDMVVFERLGLAAFEFDGYN